MVTRTFDILKRHCNDKRLGNVVLAAIEFIASSNVDQEHGPTGTGQASKSVAELHAFRKRSGYYKNGGLIGLDETIESLGNCDTIVWARVMETSRAYIAIWLDEQDVLLGVIIFKKDNPI